MKDSRICFSQNFLPYVQAVSCLLCTQTYKSNLAEFKVYKTQAAQLHSECDGWDLCGFKLSQSIKSSEKAAFQVAQTSSVWKSLLRVVSCE